MYGPYEHAKKYYSTIFNYANKIIKNKPTIIVLVAFPWYNQQLNGHSELDYRQLFRSFTRQVCLQHKSDPTPFSQFNPEFTGNETICRISQHISGIVFLADDTILSECENAVNVQSFMYTNLNAINPLQGFIASDMLCRYLPSVEFDGFEHDNY